MKIYFHICMISSARGIGMDISVKNIFMTVCSAGKLAEWTLI